MSGILCHPSLKKTAAAIQNAVLTDEARAAIVRDSIGRITDGDYRQRVYETALAQIRNAKAVAVADATGSSLKQGRG